jgi:hypothetical protein
MRQVAWHTVKTMTGHLSEIVAKQHIEDLLAEAERDRTHRVPGKSHRWSRLTTHPTAALRSVRADPRSVRADPHRRAAEPAGTAATRSDSAAIDSDRPPILTAP